MSRLPDRMSDLIEVALRDVRACAMDPRYVMNMGAWHDPTGDGRCEVCAAGAVMAKTLGADPDRPMFPYQCGEERAKLDAICILAMGTVGHAAKAMGIEAETIEQRGLAHGSPGGSRMDCAATVKYLERLAMDMRRVGW